MEKQISSTKALKHFDKLPAAIKRSILEDSGIGKDTTRGFETEPEIQLQVLLRNMGKEDRNRAIFDLLMDMEAEERSELAAKRTADQTAKIIDQNHRMIFLTGAMALAAFIANAIALAALLGHH